MSDNNPVSHLIPGDPVRTVKNIVGGATDTVKDLLDRRGNEEHDPLPTVDQVDPLRYAGRWFELARLPLRFQKDETLSVAEYTAFIDGTIGVHNVAFLGEEVDHTIDGTATPAEGAEESFNRLKVKFGGVVAFVPVADEGNYWILELADDYSMALVGTPDRRTLWILAREESAAGTPRFGEYLTRAAELGFDVDKLIYADWETRTTSATSTS